MEEKIYYVYAHYDGNGILKYIGKGKDNRAWGYIQRSDKWKDFFKKNKIEVKILKSELTEREALDEEIFKIAEARKNNVDLLNYGNGGESGVKYWLGKKRDPELIKKLVELSHTPEAIEKRRQKMIGRILSDDHKKSLSEKLKGRSLSEENKKNISLAKKGRPNGLKGRIMPEEHKQKIADSRKNNPNVLASSKQIWETRRANGTATGYTTSKARAVLCIDTGEVFRTAKDAAIKMNLSDKHIQACCVGRRQRHGKLTWKYL